MRYIALGNAFGCFGEIPSIIRENGGGRTLAGKWQHAKGERDRERPPRNRIRREVLGMGNQGKEKNGEKSHRDQ